MLIRLNINDRAALSIKNNEKKIEIRANNKEEYQKLKSNDIIEFNSQKQGIFYCKVEEVNYYKSIEELLTLEGTRYTTSSTNDYNTAIENVNKIDNGNYEKIIKENGVYAIHIKYLYSNDTVWDELYEHAKKVINKRDVSGLISAGSVGAAILTENHHIYTGVCIDTASTLGMCAERNAIASMITNNENKIIKLVCIDSKGNVGFPCGACREYLMQLDKDSKNIEILKDKQTKETILLETLIPDWWAYDRV